MNEGCFQARLHIGNKVEILGHHASKSCLVVALSSRLEEEPSGTSGDIIDIKKRKIIYQCCKRSY